MGEGGDSVRGRKACQRAALVGFKRPDARAMQESLEFIILSRIFEKVWGRTMTRKDEGESYEGFLGLSSTMPSALLRVRGWDQ